MTMPLPRRLQELSDTFAPILETDFHSAVNKLRESLGNVTSEIESALPDLVESLWSKSEGVYTFALLAIQTSRPAMEIVGPLIIDALSHSDEFRRRRACKQARSPARIS
jgi:hypothetical protein